MSGLDNTDKQRIRAASSIEMSEATRDAHIAAMADAIASAHRTPSSVPVSAWRLRVAGVTAAFMVVLPVGTALAAESALPGDLLYPIKRLVEPVRSVLDSNVAARHRVEELTHMVDTATHQDRVAEAVVSARDAVSDLPLDHILRVDLAAATDRVTDEVLVDIQHERDTTTDTSPPIVTDSTTTTNPDVTTDTRAHDETTETTQPHRDTTTSTTTQTRDETTTTTTVHTRDDAATSTTKASDGDSSPGDG